jgi:hypothetical protein
MSLPSLHNLRINSEPIGGHHDPPQKVVRIGPSPSSHLFRFPLLQLPDDLYLKVRAALSDPTLSARVVCKTIESWCRKHKEACKDSNSDVYRKAIAAFGYLPEHADSYKGPFASWRELFWALCTVFTEYWSKFPVKPQFFDKKKIRREGRDLWQGMADRLDLRDRNHGNDKMLREVVRSLLREADLSDRDLDEFENALKNAYIKGGGGPEYMLQRKQLIEGAFENAFGDDEHDEDDADADADAGGEAMGEEDDGDVAMADADADADAAMADEDDEDEKSAARGGRWARWKWRESLRRVAALSPTWSPTWSPWEGEKSTAWRAKWKLGEALQWRAIWWLLRQKGAGARGPHYWTVMDAELYKLYSDCIEGEIGQGGGLLLKKEEWKQKKEAIYALINLGADPFDKGAEHHLNNNNNDDDDDEDVDNPVPPEYMYLLDGNVLTVFELAHRTHNEEFLNVLYSKENAYSFSRDPRAGKNPKPFLQPYILSPQAGKETVDRYFQKMKLVLDGFATRLKEFATWRKAELFDTQPYTTLSSASNTGTEMMRAAKYRIFKLVDEAAGPETETDHRPPSIIALVHSEAKSLKKYWFSVLEQVDEIDRKRRRKHLDVGLSHATNEKLNSKYPEWWSWHQDTRKAYVKRVNDATKEKLNSLYPEWRSWHKDIRTALFKRVDDAAAAHAAAKEAGKASNALDRPAPEQHPSYSEKESALHELEAELIRLASTRHEFEVQDKPHITLSTRVDDVTLIRTQANLIFEDLEQYSTESPWLKLRTDQLKGSWFKVLEEAEQIDRKRRREIYKKKTPSLSEEDIAKLDSWDPGWWTWEMDMKLTLFERLGIVTVAQAAVA